MEKLASTLLDNTKKLLDDSPNLVTGLLAAGGLGALGGAVFTGPNGDPNETAGDVRMRRLKNALIGAGMAAGATGLAAYGTHNFETALPVADVDPVTKTWFSPATRAVGSGVALTGAASYNMRNSKGHAQDILSALGMGEAKYPIRAVSDKLKSNGKAGLSGLFDGIADKTKVKNISTEGESLANSLRNALNSDKLVSDALRRAGVSSKGLGAADLQGTLSVLPKSVNKVLQAAGSRHIARNKWVYGAGLAGAALPEVGAAAGSWIGNLTQGNPSGNEQDYIPRQ